MPVFDAELYAASCALQYAVSLLFAPKAASPSVDNQAAICSILRPGCFRQAPLLRDICKAISTLLRSGSVVQIGRTPSHTGIMGNGLADAVVKLAVDSEDNPPDGADFPWSYPHLRSQIRGRLLQEWQVWHKPRDDFPFSPSTKLSAIFTLPRTTRSHAPLSGEASCLLPPGPSELASPGTGALPTVQEEVETTRHAILRCPAHQYARESFPETLDLKSAWYDATAIEMLATFVQCTLTACPPGFTPPKVIGTPSSRPPSSPYFARRGLALLISCVLLD